MKHPFSDVRPFMRDPLSFLLSKAESNSGGLVQLALGFNRVFLLSDAELIKPILKAPEDLIDKGRLVRKLEPIVGRSSLTMSGEAHEMRRNALHQVLAKGTVESLTPGLLAEIRRAVFDVMQQEAFDAHTFGAGLALKLICTVLFGHQVLNDADTRALIEAVRLVEDDLATEMFRAFPPMPWTAFQIAKKRRFAKEVISLVVNKIETKAADSSVLRTLKSLGLTKDELRDEVVTMLLAGHHTSGAAIAWMLYFMSTDPSLVNQLALEAEDCRSTDGEIDPVGLKHSAASMALGKEVLRLCPPSWWFAREVKRPHELAGVKLNRGDSLLISQWVFHRSARYWPEPSRMDLSRNFNSKAYIPFGAGPRACIGMGVAMLELQLVALELAAAFEIELAEAPSLLAPVASVTLAPPPIRLRLKIRETGLSTSLAVA